MSSNTLVAICVGCLFALALVTIVVSYLERVRILRPRTRQPAVPDEEKQTERQTWPKHDGP